MQVSVVSDVLVGVVVGEVTEVIGEVVSTVGVGLSDGFTDVSKVSLSPKVPSLPSRDT
jgi:branched-subunit amino acid ABC-type transport system permease component